MPKLNLRLRHYEDYNRPVFICRSTYPEEADSHEKLKVYLGILMELKEWKWLPIKESRQFHYTTIIFRKSPMLQGLTPGELYNVDFSIKILHKDGELYAHAFLNSIDAIDESVFEQGENIDFE